MGAQAEKRDGDEPVSVARFTKKKVPGSFFSNVNFVIRNYLIKLFSTANIAMKKRVYIKSS